MTALIHTAKERAGILIRLLLVFLLAAALIPLTALLAPLQVFAAASDPPDVLTGRFVLNPSFSSSPSYQGDFPGTVTLDGGYRLYCFGNNGAGDNGRASCISPGAANWGDPANLNNRGGTVRATWYSNDPEKNIAWYRMTVTPDNQPAVGAAGVQYLGNTWLAITWDFDGWIKIVKTSARPAVSQGDGYSLEGATYELYRTSDNGLAAVLVTDKNGEATSSGLAPGNYYLIEKTAPSGFRVDIETHNVTVAAGEIKTVVVRDEPLGWIELVKTSANPDITQQNDCYSLAGAVYGVYRSVTDAAADTNRLTTLVTDANGYAKSPKMVELGTLYVREVTAPKGYAEDRTIHPVIHDKATTRVSVADRPQSDPEAVFVGKLDADTTAEMPQGSASLAGAIYTIRYFDGYYKTVTEAETSGLPTRIWYVRTDATGKGMVRESYLAEGSDALYHNSYGDATIPLGTVIIEESTAPTGYILPSPALVFIQQVTATSQMESVTTYNAPVAYERVARGDVSITKAYDASPEDDTGVMTPEESIAFDFYASRDFSGARPNDGAAPAFTLVTDKDGHADSSGIYVIQNADGTYTQRSRQTGDGGGVSYDTYLMVQRDVPDGFEAVKPMLISITEDGRTYDYLLQNGTVQTALRVVKVDSETGRTVPYPAVWRIVDVVTGKPVVMTVHYPTEEVLDVFASDSQGRLTLPEKLPLGDYELQEVCAPASGGTGYVLNPVGVPFSTAAGHDWGNPLTITFADVPAKGRIEVVKSDAVTGEPVAGATYVIRAADDIYTLDETLRAYAGEIVDTITTDSEGYAVSHKLYLGRYDVIEAISPEGFALDSVHHTVTLEYEGQDVAVTRRTLELSDEPSTLIIEKIDALSGRPLEGVTFSVKSEDTDYSHFVTTGKDGTAALGYLPHGTYTVSETGVPDGYVTNEDTHRFSVDDQGLIEGRDSFKLVVSNIPLQVSISKTDITTDEELPGCGLEIYRSDDEGKPVGEALHFWVSTEEPHLIVGGLVPGDYVLHETYPAAGFATAKDVAFAVSDTGEIQRVVMKDEPLKAQISKRDITTDAELPGAHLAIYAIDEKEEVDIEPLYEWVSSDVPYVIERIAAGDYILHEDVAPKGYGLAQDVSFTITDSGEVQTVVMYDEATPEIPEIPEEPETPTPDGGYDRTGRDTAPLLVGFVLLFTGGVIGLVLGIRNMRRKEKGADNAGAIGEKDGSECLMETDGR
jgi:hypothetical protein